MSLYLKPPRGLINVYKLEECVKQRLICYDNIYNNDLEISNFDCLIEDSALDRTGHYLFRLMAYSSNTFREIFLHREQKLLLLRLNCYDRRDIVYFLKRLSKQSQEGLNELESHDSVRELYTALVKICSQMLRKKYLDHVYNESHSDGKHCDDFILRVPFYICSSLIYNREVNLRNGFVEIQCKVWKKLLLSVYDTYLRKVLIEMEFSRNVLGALTDGRINQVLELIKNRWFKSECGNNVSKFNIKEIDEESSIFPLCMLNLYKVLQKTNRLSHNERFDFSLYMKGIGVSLSDSLIFWESAYSKQHASCSKCTHNWQENEKRYIYGIRHLYGLEGSRRNYQVRSCSYLQEKCLGATENGGCPFTHFDDTNLRKALKKVLPNREDDVEVMIYERKENPSESCRLFYESVFRTISNKNLANDIKFKNPVEYYLALKSDTDKEKC